MFWMKCLASRLVSITAAQPNWREPLRFVLAFFPQPSPLRIPKKLCWICTRLGGYKNQSLLMALIHEKALASFFSLSLSSSRPLKEGFLLGVIAIVHSDLGNGWILDGIWSHMKTRWFKFLGTLTPFVQIIYQIIIITLLSTLPIQGQIWRSYQQSTVALKPKKGVILGIHIVCLNG